MMFTEQNYVVVRDTTAKQWYPCHMSGCLMQVVKNEEVALKEQALSSYCYKQLQEREDGFLKLSPGHARKKERTHNR